jgi:hypothetical protein
MKTSWDSSPLATKGGYNSNQWKTYYLLKKNRAKDMLFTFKKNKHMDLALYTLLGLLD